jgi:hypothetical protein
MEWTSIIDDELQAIRDRLAERHAAEVARQKNAAWWAERAAVTQHVKRMIEEARA